MTLTTVSIDDDHLKRLGKIAKKHNRSKTQQVHQLIEDEEKTIKISEDSEN